MYIPSGDHRPEASNQIIILTSSINCVCEQKCKIMGFSSKVLNISFLFSKAKVFV
jgi:hypothetical protein